MSFLALRIYFNGGIDVENITSGNWLVNQMDFGTLLMIHIRKVNHLSIVDND